MKSKFAYLLMGLLGSVGLVTAFALPASAAAHPHSVSTFTRYTQAGQYATAGYFTSPLNGNAVFTHIQGYLGSSGTTSLENLGTGVDNGQGVGLCNQSTGNAVRAGIGNVDATAGTKSVIFGEGNLGAAFWFGDPCANGAPNGTTFIVTDVANNIPIQDTIAVQMLAHSGFGASGCAPFQTALLWQDVTANPGVWHTACESTSFHPVYNEGDAGVIGDTTEMSPPATQPLAAFAHLGLSELNGHRVTHGSFQSDSAWTAYPVEATSNGAASGSLLLADNPFRNDGMGILSGSSDG